MRKEIIKCDNCGKEKDITDGYLYDYENNWTTTCSNLGITHHFCTIKCLIEYNSIIQVKEDTIDCGD